MRDVEFRAAAAGQLVVARFLLDTCREQGFKGIVTSQGVAALELAERFKVRSVPTLILIKGKRAVGRIEGKANAAEIEQLVDQHLDDGAKSAPREQP